MNRPDAATAEPTLAALEARAAAILEARPAYAEIVGFYMGVFRQQVRWRAMAMVNPAPVRPAEAAKCMARGVSLATRFDPGLDASSLAACWADMKDVFRSGNAVLRDAVARVEQAERRGDFQAGLWLAQLRPGRDEAVLAVARSAAVEPEFLGSLARAATLPHWQAVALAWLAERGPAGWTSSWCPVCDGPPVLGVLVVGRPATDGLKAAPARRLCCAFCGTTWDAPSLRCPGCGSDRAGDARYWYSPDAPGVRIDFCRRCKGYLKVVEGERVGQTFHLGLELIALAHLDRVATSRGLAPVARGMSLAAGGRTDHETDA